MSDEALSSARIDELREKFEKDPNSKIFLQLAEELRKAHRFDEAVTVCLAGLRRHPGYTTARVTLGRAYMGARKFAEAKAEFQAVIGQVPDNILAHRCLGDIFYEEGLGPQALERYRVVAMLSPKDEDVQARIRSLEAPPLPSAAPARAAAPAPPPGAGGGEDDEAFMDLKIDESLILNANMISATLGKSAVAAAKPGAPAVPPRPPVTAKPAAPPVAKAPAPPPGQEVSFENMEEPGELGGMGMDDFSDFSSPTVMLNAKDLAALAESATPPAPVPAAPAPRAAAAPAPARPAAPVPARPAAPPPTLGARSAEKFGIGRYQEEEAVAPAPRPAAPIAPAARVAAPAPRPAAPSAPAARVAPPPPPPAPSADEFGGGEEVGAMGLEDFSEFAAPTVMMNVADLLKSGALSEKDMEDHAAVEAAPVPTPAAAAEVDEVQSGIGPSFGPEDAFGRPDSFASSDSFSESSTFANLHEDVVDERPADAGLADAPEAFGTRAFQGEEVHAMTPAVVPDEEVGFGTRAFQPEELASLPAPTSSAAAPALEAPEPEPEPESFGTRAFQAEDLQAMVAKAAAARMRPELEQATAPAAPDEPFGGPLHPAELAVSPGAEVPPYAAGSLGTEAASGWESPLEPAAALVPPAEPEAAEEDMTGKTLGELYLQQGHLDRALEIFERHLAAHPFDSEVRARVEEIRHRLEPPVPARAVAEPRAAPVAAGIAAESADERKARVRQKLTSWLSSTKKT